MSQGGYQTLHYIDGAGDGWIERAARNSRASSARSSRLTAWSGCRTFSPR